MGWKQWSAVAVVIGGGVLLQIPGHDDANMDPAAMGLGAVESGEMAEMAEMAGPFRTVVLDVTGMT